MSYQRNWLEQRGSDDSSARAFWAACVTAADGPTPGLRRWGRDLAKRVAPRLGDLAWPRSNAYALLGLCALKGSGLKLEGLDHWIKAKAQALMVLLERHLGSDWEWFEDFLSYDNSRLPEALIRAGLAIQDRALLATGLRSLKWLFEILDGPNGEYRGVGTESFGAIHQVPALFDQQPLEAAATIDACYAAFCVDGDPYWMRKGEASLQWFGGGNEIGADMAAAGAGECFDGLGAGGINYNQGAESLMARQFALCAMEDFRLRFNLETCPR